MNWTVEKVKDELPHIRVKFEDGTRASAIVSGRRLDFPQISINVHGSWVKVDATWSAIAHSLNNNKPIGI